MVETTEQIYSFAEFEVDAAKRRLSKNGAPVALNPKAFDLLLALIENRGQIVHKEALLETVWTNQFVEENNLTVHISALRKIFGEKKGENRFIATVPGKGYKFVAELAEAGESAFTIENHSFSRIVVEEEFLEPETEAVSAPPKQIAAPDAPRRQTRRLPRHLPAIAGAILLLAILGIGGYLRQREQSAKNAAPFQQISIKRLTTGGEAQNAALSPDGKLFVYSAGSPCRLWLGHTAGGEPLELRPAADVAYRSLRFAPDGNSLYYVVTGKEYPTGALFRLSVFGGVPERLRENIRTPIALAPDVNQFAYVVNDREKNASTLFIADTHGDARREVVTRPIKFQFDAASVAWSADGTAIAAGAISEAGDGVNYEVFAVSTADGHTRQITDWKFRTIPGLAWLKDGSGLTMVAVKQPQLDHQLWYVSYPDGAVRQINPDLNNYGASLAVSADGNSLLAVQVESSASIWTAPADALANARQITFTARGGRDGKVGLEWMPDNRLIYSAFAGKSHPLWTMNADGGGKKRLTPDGAVDLNPTVTADGRIVVFGSNRSGAFEVWRVNIDGDDLRQLTFGGYNEQPSVSPDGKYAVYISMRDGLDNVWRVPLEGGDSVKISDRPSSWARVSPDSRFVACGYEDGGKTKLAVLPIEGGAPIKMFDLPASANLRYALRWTPDGEFLTYRDWENGLWRQSLDGGAPQRIKDLPEEKLFAYDWSPDGRQIAFTRGTDVRDVVLLQNINK